MVTLLMAWLGWLESKQKVRFQSYKQSFQDYQNKYCNGSQKAEENKVSHTETG